MSVGTRSSSLIGFNGSCLNGGPRQPGRKGSRTQASQQHSASSQVRGQLRGRGHSWEEMAPTGVLWKGERPQGNKEAPLGDPASNRDPIPPSPQEDEQKSPGKGPSRSKTPTPEKTRLPDKVLAPETIPAPDKVSIPKDPFQRKPQILTKFLLQRIPLWTRLALQRAPFLGISQLRMKPLT